MEPQVVGDPSGFVVWPARNRKCQGRRGRQESSAAVVFVERSVPEGFRADQVC